MTTAAIIKPETIAERVAWAKANLFNSKGNTVLTLFSVGAAGVLLFLTVRYVLFQANWGLVTLNRRLFFVGSYPADEMVRIWIAVFLVVGLISITYGLWGGRLRPYLLVIGVVAAIVLTLGLGTEVRVEEHQFQRGHRVGRPVDHSKRHQQGSCRRPGMGAVVVIRDFSGACRALWVNLGVAGVCLRDARRRGVGRQVSGEMAR